MSHTLYVDGSPFVRCEVDDKKPEDSWLRAHLHVAAESRLLGYLRGVRGQKRIRLNQLHLPVGGFRYRPCLEDFLEFAIDENLIPAKEGWKAVLDDYREDYRRRQLISLVERHPEVAQETLDHLRSTSEE